MKIRKVIRKPLGSDEDGLRVAGAVNAAVAANVNEPGSQAVSSSSRQRIVQSSGRTEIYEENVDTQETKGGENE